MDVEPVNLYEALPDDLADSLREGLARRVLDVFQGMPADLARDCINHALFALEARSVVVSNAAPGLSSSAKTPALNQRLEVLYQSTQAANISAPGATSAEGQADAQPLEPLHQTLPETSPPVAGLQPEVAGHREDQFDLDARFRGSPALPSAHEIVLRLRKLQEEAHSSPPTIQESFRQLLAAFWRAVVRR